MVVYGEAVLPTQHQQVKRSPPAKTHVTLAIDAHAVACFNVTSACFFQYILDWII